MVTQPTDASPDAIREAYELQRRTFLEQPSPSLQQRRRWLALLLSAVATHREDFVEAIREDFQGARARVETLGAEVMVVEQGIAYLRNNLADWMAVEERHISLLFAPARGEVHYQPKGVVGVISPWNYPVQLALMPIATALAAGNRVMLKPSELTPRTSALLARILHQAFPPDLVSVCTGGVDVGVAFSEIPFDHLLYTGSTSVGRKIMAAAAKNLTPVTLELGGKSPVILHRRGSVSLAAERVCWGKFLNAGQTCVAPDYVLVPSELENSFVDQLTAQIQKFYPTIRDNDDYTAIIHPRHRARLLDAVTEAEKEGARVTRVIPATEDLSDSPKIAPTIVQDVPLRGTLMSDEIFGPVLPVIPYETLEQAIAFVNARPRPLALYYFDRSDARVQRMIEQTHAGGMCVNDTALHVAQDDLPFGGSGASGIGAYHGREGFLALSHAKAVFRQRRFRLTQLFNPPYGRAVDVFLRAVLR